MIDFALAFILGVQDLSWLGILGVQDLSWLGILGVQDLSWLGGVIALNPTSELSS
ncbi:MAG: hypothetical protein ABFS56_22950 [Pseudomonadota bacterium]